MRNPQSSTISAFRAASTRHRARCTTLAATLSLGFFGAASGTATFDERLGELAKLHLGLVRFCQMSRVNLELWRDVPKKVEEQSLSVEQMLYVNQYC